MSDHDECARAYKEIEAEVDAMKLQIDELRETLTWIRRNHSSPAGGPHDGPCPVCQAVDVVMKLSEKRVSPVPLTNQTACCQPHTPGMSCDCGCHG